MPPYLSRRCPQCHQTNQFDLVELKRGFYPFVRSIIRGDKPHKEYPVRCKHCGHEFVVQVDDDAAR